VKSFRGVVYFVSALSLCVLTARAQDDERSSANGSLRLMRLPVRNDSRLWLEGSSNVRDWTCVAKTIDATLEVETATDGDAHFMSPRSVRGVSVKVPVRTLKCGDRHMEANMYRALKAPKPPATSFIIAEFSGIPAGVNEGGTVVTGRMTVAGVERPVRMLVRMDELPDGTRKATGSVPIRMTDFGITPPRPWMGLLRAANEVLVRFEIYVSPPPTTVRASGETFADSGGK
jgi:polyisoprenoid-binding protein YceI